MIERRGANTALLCTEGFRDALEVRQELPFDLYDPFATFPQPLVRRSQRLGVPVVATVDVITGRNVPETVQESNPGGNWHRMSLGADAERRCL